MGFSDIESVTCVPNTIFSNHHHAGADRPFGNAPHFKGGLDALGKILVIFPELPVADRDSSGDGCTDIESQQERDQIRLDLG